MISTINRLFAGTQTSTRWIAVVRHILFSAFLSLALAVPYASAACGGSNLARGVAVMPSALFSPAALQGDSEDALPSEISDSFAPIDPATTATMSIVGLWNVTFTSGGQVIDIGFDDWHADRSEELNDYTPPAEGNVCLGTWEQSATNTYKLKHPSWSFDKDGNLLGTVVIYETVTLSSTGNSYSGSYIYDIYDTKGKFVVKYTGTLKATRIMPS